MAQEGVRAPPRPCRSTKERCRGLSGLQVYKLLPKTNCKDCGFPTCMAFAMQLARQGGDREVPAREPRTGGGAGRGGGSPIRKITVGVGERAVTVGEETVMFGTSAGLSTLPARRCCWTIPFPTMTSMRCWRPSWHRSSNGWGRRSGCRCWPWRPRTPAGWRCALRAPPPPKQRGADEYVCGRAARGRHPIADRRPCSTPPPPPISTR